MAYAHLEESLQLLQGAAPSDTAVLSRRRRHLALASDRDGDVAATLFLRRGVSGQPQLDVHHLEAAGPSWRLLGGGSGSLGAALPRWPAYARGSPARRLSRGGTARAAGRLRPWGGGWVRSVTLQLAPEVSVLQVGDRRLTVAAHGIAVVAWKRRPPTVTALDARGEPLGTIRLPAC